MSIPKFTYLAPKTLKEALIMRASHGSKSSIMAGGTDLLIKMGLRTLQPEFVIGLNSVPEIDYITLRPGGELAIGPMAKLSAVVEDAEVEKNFPALSEAASVTATVQIRNMGTLIGNICNASPSADNATPLMIYDTKVVIIRSDGERVVPIEEFFKGPGKSVLETGELVKEFLIPIPEKSTGSNYQKVSTRSKVDIAGICVSALLTLNNDGTVSKARIALGAVAPKPIRVVKAEKILTGKTPTKELFNDAAKIAREEASPISDMRASAEYRKAMVEVLTRRALDASLAAATKKKN